ncbi:MAG TPA: hypothetical protein VJ975_05180 [Candidatus Limnocylindria bacterium]|nr:hypothetical protein [Candidatus Limnocylindria bacterium]
MNRTNRIALMAAIVLVLVVTGTVFATRAPSADRQPAQVTQDEEDTPPTAEEIAHAADRLRAKEIAVDDAVFNELVTAYGIGGAVRVMAWSNGDPGVIDQIRRMRDGDATEDSGMGWGRIAKDLGVNPGIGSIMGNGGGHGRDNAPGQQGRDDDEDGASGG